MSSARLAAAVAACLAVATAAAEVQSPIEPVIVTATRTALPADEVLAPVLVIDRAELARNAGADVADVLRFQAGLEIGRTGAIGQPASLFIRGTDSNHSLVLVDGIRINPGTIGAAALQNLSADLIERIEIVKGPRSTLYGSDAIGGVVNVITRRDTGASLQLGGGRYDTTMGSLHAGLRGTAGDLHLGASWLDSAGMPTRTTDQTPRGHRNASVTLSGRTAIGGVELGARAWRASGNTEYSDFFLTPIDQDFENSSLAVDAAFRPTTAWQTRLTLSHATDDVQQNQPPFPGAANDYLETRRWQFDWQNDVAIGQHQQVTVGALLQRESAASLSYGLGYDEDTAVDLYYLQDRISVGRQQLLLAVGLTDHETFGRETTWNAEYGFRVLPRTTLIAAAGTAFRAPDATDRYGFGGNPDLAPESSRNVELGVRHGFGTGHTVSLSAFRNEVDDLIEYVITDFQTFDGQNRNVARAEIEGVELTWDYSGEQWRTRAAVTLQDPRDLGTDQRLLRRARETATLSIARRIGRHELSIDTLYAGNRRDFGFPSAVTMDDYVVANLAATFAIGERVRVTTRLENAFDTDYELARGYVTPGRSLFAAVRYDFR